MAGMSEPEQGTSIQVPMDVQEMTITSPDWPDTPLGHLGRQLGEVVTAVKALIGHGEHDGWRSEDGIARVYCGCGALICDLTAGGQVLLPDVLRGAALDG